MSGQGPTSQTRGLAGRIVRFSLQPAAIAYGLGAYLRLSAYARNILRQARTAVPVVSVGNITCGGTGKTPVVIDVAQKLMQAGYKPAVLSRGYKRKSQAPSMVVSDGTAILASCAESGDEPYLIATKCPGVTVIVGARRKDTARIAIEQYGCDVILLDDGFQHLGIARDLDVVLIDYNDDPAEDAVLPAGRLREPVAALARANAILITKVPVNPDERYLEKLGKYLHKHSPEASIGLVRFAAEFLVGINQANPQGEALTQHDVQSIAGKRVLAFCALARPDSFFQSLSNLKVTVVGTHAFPDHHWYTRKDLQKLQDEGERLSCDLLLTTEKDLVKLLEFKDSLRQPVMATTLTTTWVGGIPNYLNQLLAAKSATQNKHPLSEPETDRSSLQTDIANLRQLTPALTVPNG
jgi:tetraacyldisaccharide 4'-kinase